MNDLFGGVVYAGIDTDRYKYPIGSGRVTFGNQKSFMKAVKAGFVEIKTPKFNKKVGGTSFALSVSYSRPTSGVHLRKSPTEDNSMSEDLLGVCAYSE